MENKALNFKLKKVELNKEMILKFQNRRCNPPTDHTACATCGICGRR